MSFNWRYTYFVSIGLRFILALSNSYIHPDEHFQNFEVITHRILGFSTSIPWEFTSDSPARSLGPLYLIYGPVLYAIKVFGLQFSPLQIMYLFRIIFLVVSWLVIDISIHKLLPTRPERIKGIFFVSTSYVVSVYQSHCFSNSVETLVLILCVLIIEELRYHTNFEVPTQANILLGLLGGLVSFGIFNRITFPAFLIIPSYFVVKFIWYSKSIIRSILSGLIGFILPTSLFILIDTIGFGHLDRVLSDPLQFTNYVITPWNSLVYNTNASNLAIHGIHPYYTHLLINLPQLVGPAGLIFLFYKRNKYYTTIPFLTAVSGVVFLSIVPHQELRFLIPIVPLLCCCFDLEKFSEIGTSPTQSPKLMTFLMTLWYGFNIILAFLMGTFHQGGVLPALDYFHETQKENTSMAQVWWRTYSPPSWLLGSTSLQIVTHTSHLTKDTLPTQGTVLVDTMGSDYQHVLDTVKELKSTGFEKVYLVTPISSYLIDVKNKHDYEAIWNYTTHLDLDHIDVSDTRSLTPGLGIYELL
ncbi:GPI mannosyltransferase 4 [[Candida] anglica]|uniref:Mannosyltransferase n=1 Tax=[Candida] anglica TaxID=148631 RepID=A0ABP0EEM3_9ASCO